MRRAVAIRHVIYEDAGSLEAVLAERGFSLTYVDMGTTALSAVDLSHVDLLIVLGGPISVNDERLFPFIKDEIALLQDRIAQQLPTLGICLGGQLIAKALGAEVKKGLAQELGWAPLHFHHHEEAPYLSALDNHQRQMFHWHGETFDLPENAQLLASSDLYSNQMFSYGNTLALQCHPEVIPASIENWFIGNILEISLAELDLMALRDQVKTHGPQLEHNAKAFFHGWMDHVGL